MTPASAQGVGVAICCPPETNVVKLTSLGNLIIPIAQGPQYHADELDSAWDTIKNLVPPRLERSLAKQITGETPAQAMANPRRKRNPSRYRNPEEGEEVQEEAPAASTGMAGLTGKEKADTTIETWKLALPAMLVTGQWGKPEEPEDRRRHLEMIDARYPNPKGAVSMKADRSNFFDRMVKLDAALTELIDHAGRKYAARGIDDLKKMGWVKALSNCRRDVQWVLQQKDLAYAGNAKVVQEELPNRTQRAKRTPRAKKVKTINTVMGLTKLWSIISAKGNNKLPFAAYSTLPMASCPGAGTCAVAVTGGRLIVNEKQGYCYSFTAWRYPDAFARQFRNQLAETADREFAIMAGAAKAGLDPDTLTYEQRVRMALSQAGRESRSWHRIVALQTIAALKSKLMLGKSCFLRIYVDGDINTEDNIVEWMQMCLDIGPQGELMDGFVVDKVQQHIECYGYSKCWQQFVNVDKMIDKRWPLNYTVNMSKDSIYAGPNYTDIEKEMYGLKITRGYFESIPIKRAVVDLVDSYDVSTGTVKPFPMPDPAKTPFPFDLSRINQIVEINARMADAERKGLTEATETAQKLATKIGFDWTADPEPQKDQKKAIEQLRSSLYRAYFAYLLTDGRGFYGIVEAELAKDDNVVFESGQPDIARWRLKTEGAKLKAAKKLAKDKGITEADVEAFVNEKVAKYRGTIVTSKRWQDKALALSLHEAIWATTTKGGSCPLVCGNCFDTVAGNTTVKPVHRCASKDAFKDRTIYIGRH